jgi:hypothetical protein
MKSRLILSALILCFVGTAASLAADEVFNGTWKLNEAKSKLGPGLPKNHTVVYEAAGDSVKITIDGTSSSGEARHSEWTGKFDGKDYPVTGDPTADTRSVTKVSGHKLTVTAKKGGKVTTVAHVTVSPDGKTRTVTVTATDSSGKKATGTAVYDKQ